MLGGWACEGRGSWGPRCYQQTLVQISVLVTLPCTFPQASAVHRETSYILGAFINYTKLTLVKSAIRVLLLKMHI